jgi:alanine racemase
VEGRIKPVLVMSHLACADEPGHAMNALQRERFAAAARAPRRHSGQPGEFLGGVPGAGFHHDLVRPGAALYGINPQPGAPNPLRQAVALRARIVQSRTVQAGDIVGYGARYVADGPRRIATIADRLCGWLAALAVRPRACLRRRRARAVCRDVSMDSITLDVTGIAEERVQPGCEVDLLGAQQTVDDVAREAGTIGYEVLTRLGAASIGSTSRRHSRVRRESGASWGLTRTQNKRPLRTGQARKNYPP